MGPLLTPGGGNRNPSWTPLQPQSDVCRLDGPNLAVRQPKKGNGAVFLRRWLRRGSGRPALDLGLHPAAPGLTPTAILETSPVGTEHSPAMPPADKPAEHQANGEARKEQGDSKHIHRGTVPSTASGFQCGGAAQTQGRSPRPCPTEPPQPLPGYAYGHHPLAYINGGGLLGGGWRRAPPGPFREGQERSFLSALPSGGPYLSDLVVLLRSSSREMKVTW